MMPTPIRRAWALSLFWMGVIVLESFIGSAGNTSRLLYPVLHFLFPKMSFLRQLEIHYCLRKAGHFFGYSILSLTLYRSWWTTLTSRVSADRLRWKDMVRDWDWRAASLALLGTLAMAAFDEFYQSFSPARTASVWDVALDEIGGILAQSVLVTVSSVALARRTHSAKAQPQGLTSS